jgi:hypothetical protein
MELFVNTPEDGYYFKASGIKQIEEKYAAKYMGYWCTKSSRGGWNERPVDVFYQPNPNVELGHKHYFGMFVQNETPYICDASSAFAEPIGGIVCEDGEVIVSRYRHDYVTKGDRMVDGGRDYMRASLHPSVTIAVSDGQFIIKEDVK